MATSPALVHDGSACACDSRAVVFHPIGDSFLCAGCLMPYDDAIVGTAPTPVVIMASKFGPAVQSELCAGSARALALAGFYPVGTLLAFVRCDCGCSCLTAAAP